MHPPTPSLIRHGGSLFRATIVLATLAGGWSPAHLHAQAPALLWRIGQDADPYVQNDNPTDEFSQENWTNDAAPGVVTRLPGDPLFNAGTNPGRDDHHYMAGTYPAGFNSLSSPRVVPNPEPDTAWERALTNSDVTNHVHFLLNAAQAGPQSRLRLTFEMVGGGTWNANTSTDGENFGSHNLRVRFRNASATTLLLDRPGIDRDTRFTIDIPAASVQALAGPNSLEFTRTGPTMPSGTSAWLSFDFVEMEVDPDGLADADNDGLPRWWEENHHLDDTNAADAGQDFDGDGLSSLQEYHSGVLPSDPRHRDADGDGATDPAERAAGSNPLLADTDGDGLDDGGELSGPMPSSPILADTDADGAPDAWEKRVGSNPGSAASKPAAFSGIVGLNIVSAESPEGTMPWLLPAGPIPQIHWNNTTPLRGWSRQTGNTGFIASPVAGSLVNGHGQIIPGLTVSWTSENAYGSYNDGTGDRKLMNGFLRASGGTPAVLTLQGIPFASYHVFAVVGGSYDGQEASVEIIGDAATTRAFRTTTTPPQSKWLAIRPTAGNPNPIGNLVHYPDRGGPNLSLRVNNINGWGVGLHAIQIVDATADTDGSGIPDWYEMLHGLQPAGPATAGQDLDGDGLGNLQEFQRGSNPRAADTDGDGLRDDAEPAANVLTVDSDGDGLSDADEVNAALPGNPSLADSDGDGIDDRTERDLGQDPAHTPSAPVWVPVYSASPARWEWTIAPLQLVWDHGTGATGGHDGTTDTLLGFYLVNQGIPEWRSIAIMLESRNGRVTYRLQSESDSAFSASNYPAGGFSLEDSQNPPVDLRAAMGFSGHGAHDISDRLQIRLRATRATGNSWSLVFDILNLSKGTTVVSRALGASTAAPNVDNGTATWRGTDGTPGRPTIELHDGLRMFSSPDDLETTAAFSPHRDTDNDGMPDAWESTYLLNPNLAADATTDADGDGLNNRGEWLAGTHPRLADTDGDSIPDRTEIEQGSNPGDASSLPAFVGSTPPTGTDFNGNGYPDAWEIHFRAHGLNRSLDSDGDGASNATEAFWGTDPFDPLSRIATHLVSDGPDAVVSWTHAPWKRQRLLGSPNLSSWQWLNLPPFSADGTQTTRVPAHLQWPEQTFFVVETKDRDSDGDGVSDWDEIFAGSDPYRRDSIRSAAAALAPDGRVLGQVAGDYAMFAAHFAGALPGGPSSTPTDAQAARFLQQATFGVTMEEIRRVKSLGLSGWLDDQFLQPPTLQRPYIENIYADVRGPRVDLAFNNDGDSSVGGNNVPTAFARAAIGGRDQLRQRVAFALHQILVTSRRDANLSGRPLAMASYYDIFARHAFGNFRDVLGEVALHPAMGRYLSHIGNQKAKPEINQFPDENFARELMQLFTIGLWELNADGTRKTNGSGQFIPTYDNGDITELARVFTGLWFGGKPWGNGGWLDEEHAVPMGMIPEKHDFGAKSLPGGKSLPARAATAENGLRDISDALDVLFNHPNTAPFISRQLIQFLVTSNPSPAYVGRVAAVFINNGQGTRGDLAAVTRAILLDEEARDARWSHGAADFGRLKDPVHRAMAISRAGRLDRFPNLLWWDYGEFYADAQQEPGYSPSVFNFYRPDYRPPGVLTQNQLAAPAFQITNSFSSISFVNRLWQHGTDGLRLYSNYAFTPDYRDLLALAGDPPALVDHANLLFCGGMMSTATRDTILDALAQSPSADALLRVQMAIFLASACPEGAIQR